MAAADLWCEEVEKSTQVHAMPNAWRGGVRPRFYPSPMKWAPLQAGGAASAGGAGGLVIDDSKVWGPLRVFLPGQAEGEGRPWFLKYLLPGWGCLFLAEICVVVNSVASSAGA